MMTRISILFFCFVYSLGNGQILDDAKEAFRHSQETQRPILLIFSGSDWCAPCIRFQKEVLSSDEFKSFSAARLVIVKADFPQRKKLAHNTQIQNDSLAQEYNPSGQFPHIVLLRPDRTVIAHLSYQHQKAAEFIADLERYATP